MTGRTPGDPGAPGFAAISFDCYGTLIDWQAGILGALRPLLSRLPDDRIVSGFALHERRIQAGPYRPYREVLREVARALLGPGVPAAAGESLPNSFQSWLPFPETNPALERLAHHFPLAIVSNVDDDLFGATRRQLTVNFRAVVTAEQVRSYKPAERHFHELSRRVGVPLSRILHVAESRYHDVEPAGRLGMTTVWINRSGEGPSASGAGGGTPDWTFPNLSALADAVDGGLIR